MDMKSLRRQLEKMVSEMRSHEMDESGMDYEGMDYEKGMEYEGDEYSDDYGMDYEMPMEKMMGYKAPKRKNKKYDYGEM